MELREDRFWAKVQKGDGCWEWTGARKRQTRYPYGLVWDGSRWLRAHRVAYELTHGPIPHGLNVCHHCDNPPCVRPDHLFVGTQADNLADARRKGHHFSPFRGRNQTGSANGYARLTEADIPIIRTLAAEGMRQKDIAARFGVHRATVSYALSGKTWTHVG